MAGTPSLLDEIRAANSTRHGPGCGVATVLKGLSEPDRKQLLAAMGDESLLHTAIAKVLTNRGLKISGDTISRHRRKLCCCD